MYIMYIHTCYIYTKEHTSREKENYKNYIMHIHVCMYYKTYQLITDSHSSLVALSSIRLP